MKHVMVDLETLGIRSQSVIVTVGAVQFDPHTCGAVGLEFYDAIDIKSALSHGLKLDASTLLWWLEQSDAARSTLVAKAKAASSMGSTLNAFRSYLQRVSPEGDAIVWGNGANFDISLLQSAYEACGMDAPWRYNNVRCYRTLRSEFGQPEDSIKPTVAHDALADAMAQALSAQLIYARLRGANKGG